MGNGTRPKTTKTAKTTSSPKNHKPDKKPQRRQKTTSQTKNHKDGKKPHHRLLRFFGSIVGAILAFLHAMRYAHGTRIKLCFDALARGFWRLFLFLTRNALRARDTHQTLLRCPCAWLLVAFPVSDTQCATRDPKTTSDPQNHKTTRKNHKRSTRPKSRKVSNINGLRKRSTKTTKTTTTCGHSHSHSHLLLYIYNII